MFKKKGDRVDMHIWLSGRHAKMLDDICLKYEISRPQVIEGLLEEYASTYINKEHSNGPQIRSQSDI